MVSAADVTVIPPTGLRRQPIAVRIDELLLRQVPTADAGPAYQGELRGTLDGVPLTAEARSDQTADGTRIAAEAALRGAPVSSEQLVLPPGFESLSATADGHLSYVLDPARKLDRLTVDVTLADGEARRRGADGARRRQDRRRRPGRRSGRRHGRSRAHHRDRTAHRGRADRRWPGLSRASCRHWSTPVSHRRQRASARTPWQIVGGRIDASDGAVVRAARRAAHAA